MNINNNIGYGEEYALLANIDCTLTKIDALAAYLGILWGLKAPNTPPSQKQIELLKSGAKTLSQKDNKYV